MEFGGCELVGPVEVVFVVAPSSSLRPKLPSPRHHRLIGCEHPIHLFIVIIDLFSLSLLVVSSLSKLLSIP